MLLLLAGLQCAVALLPFARFFIRVSLLSSLLLFTDSFRFFFSTSSFELSHFLSFQFDSIRGSILCIIPLHISHISECVTNYTILLFNIFQLSKMNNNQMWPTLSQKNEPNSIMWIILKTNILTIFVIVWWFAIYCLRNVWYIEHQQGTPILLYIEHQQQQQVQLPKHIAHRAVWRNKMR